MFGILIFLDIGIAARAMPVYPTIVKKEFS